MFNPNTANVRTSLISFGLMLAFWAFLFQSFTFALAFLVLLTIHEMGHYVVARKLGMNVSAPVFTPLGALINMREMPKNAFQEAIMAYGGPFIGTLGAVAALAIGMAVKSPEIVMAARFGFILNLFNLIPLSPLDGGRISMAISRHLWMIGAPLLAGYMLLQGDVVMILIFGYLLGTWAYRDVKLRAVQAVEDPGYFAISPSARLAVIVAYLGLAAFLLFGLTHFSELAMFFA